MTLSHSPLISQVSDNLKVAFLLPKLRKVNGKDASSTSSQVENLNRELTSRVRAPGSVCGAWEQLGALSEWQSWNIWRTLRGYRGRLP